MEKRLKSNEIDYLYAPLSKSNLQTFGNLVKSMTVKSSATAVVVKADRGWFTRMVVIAHRRQMNMQEVLTYPLATADGAPTKTAKSALLHTLEHGRATSGPRARSGPRRPSVRPATLHGNNIAIRPAKPQPKKCRFHERH